MAVAAAYAALATEEQPGVPWRGCLARAAEIDAPLAWRPGEADARYLITRGLFAERTDLLVLPDRFLPHLAYFQRHAPRLLNAIAALGEAGISREAPDAIRVGAALFNAGLFFECHEWLEGVWKVSADERKEFYHGLVQAAAAFYHYEKANMHGCRTLLHKGRRRLATYPAHFLGVDVARLEDSLARWAAHFEGSPRPPGYPRIELLPAEDAAERG